MPHMSNLSWLPLFILFNMVYTCSMAFMQMKNLNISLSNKKTKFYTKKWQW